MLGGMECFIWFILREISRPNGYHLFHVLKHQAGYQVILANNITNTYLYCHLNVSSVTDKTGSWGLRTLGLDLPGWRGGGGAANVFC